MYATGLEECLRNAEALLEDAKTLMSKGRFGTAQSLSVVSMEETGKGVILALADLKYFGEDVVNMAMRVHTPKKVVLARIEQSKILLGESLTQRASEFIIDKKKLEALTKQVEQDVRNLEEKRKNGLYVDIEPKDGNVKNTPYNVRAENVQALINRTAIFLELAKILCRAFRDIKEGSRTDIKIQEIKLPDYMLDKEAPLGAQYNYTITVVWDEI